MPVTLNDGRTSKRQRFIMEVMKELKSMSASVMKYKIDRHFAINSTQNAVKKSMDRLVKRNLIKWDKENGVYTCE